MRHFSDSQQGLLLLGPSASVGTSEFDKGRAVIKKGRLWADCEAWPPSWGKKGRGATCWQVEERRSRRAGVSEVMGGRDLK